MDGTGGRGGPSTIELRGSAPDRTRSRPPRASWERPRERAKYCSREALATPAYWGPSTRRRVLTRDGQMMSGTAWVVNQTRLATLYVDTDCEVSIRLSGKNRDALTSMAD
jgi:hypothetical protein